MILSFSAIHKSEIVTGADWLLVGVGCCEVVEGAPLLCLKKKNLRWQQLQ